MYLAVRLPIICQTAGVIVYRTIKTKKFKSSDNQNQISEFFTTIRVNQPKFTT